MSSNNLSSNYSLIVLCDWDWKEKLWQDGVVFVYL